MGSIVLYKDRDGKVYQIDEPVTSKVDLGFVAQELGLPSYIDLKYPTVERGIVSIWASINAQRLFGEAAKKKGINGPLVPLLLGGVAVKMVSPSANRPLSPLNRNVGDIDFVVPKKMGDKLVFVLSNLSNVAGTRYHYFLTHSDTMFNALRAGTRYRIRALDRFIDSQPVIKSTDILVEKLEMRHVVKFDDRDFQAARSNFYTVGLEKLIISKAQVITDVEKKDESRLIEADQSFRFLEYPYYNANRLIIGMEEKDILDLCAVLLDRFEPTDVGPNIRPDKFSEMLKDDEKFRLTVKLNLENVIRQSDWLRSKGLGASEVAKIEEAASVLLRSLGTVNKKWSKPWWNTDVETPVIV